MTSFQAPKGVSEYAPPRGTLLAAVRDSFATAATSACYGYVETAVCADTRLFVRGVGESSDVVMVKNLENGEQAAMTAGGVTVWLTERLT